MYTRYFHSHSRHLPATVSSSYCPTKTPGSGNDSRITPPESTHIQMNSYKPQFVTSPTIVNCASQKTTQYVNGNGALPYVNVETTSESVTTANHRLATIAFTQQAPTATSDTRFAQYFPPTPRPYVCPERLPSNEPAAPDRPCIPITRFEGSRIGR